MVLKHLELHRFRSYLQAAFDFSPGLNVIRGPNESGKSTLRAALLAVWFGSPASQSEAVDRWTTWGQAQKCELKLNYLDAQGRVFQLRKDFAEGKVFLVGEQESFRTPKAIQAKIQADLGIASEEFYQLCASLDVRSLANLGSAQSRKEIGKMISSLMTGSEHGQDAAGVMKKIDEVLKDLGKGVSAPCKNPGPLRTLRDRVLQLTAERARLEQELNTLESSRQDLSALTAGIRADEDRALDLTRILEANRKLQAAVQQHESLAAQHLQWEQSARQRATLEEELRAVEEQLARNPASGMRAEDIEQARDLQARRQRMAVAGPAQPPASAPLSLMSLMIGLGLALAGVLMLGRMLLAALLLAAGISLSLVAWTQIRQARKQQRAYAAERLARDAEKNILEREMLAYQARSGGNSPETILEHWAPAQEFQARARALRGHLQVLGVPDEDKWKQLRLQLRLAQDVIGDPELQVLRLAPLELAGREREQLALFSGLEEKRRRWERLQAFIEQKWLGSEKMPDLEEELAECRENLKTLEQKERIYRIIQEFVQKARRDTLNPARRILEEKSGALVSRLTGGRYNQVSVSDEDLTCLIYVPRTGRWEDPAILSQGTFDQFYLSLRITLADILAGGQRPPLLLDDPFTAFDPKRQRHAAAWLREAARERQILLFTCRPDYDSCADQVIELPEPPAAVQSI